MSVCRNVIPNYSQQDVKFLFLQILYMFQAVPPPIIRSTQLYIQLQVLSTNNAASSSIGWQYLKLYVQLYAPDDGRRNRLKHVERV